MRSGERWASASADWNWAMTEALLAEAAISPDSTVLDLAAGSGDPAVSIAAQLINGAVIAVDSSPAGLLLASTRARKLRLGPRMACLQADAHAIPLVENAVDRVTCRCGIMYFKETQGVLSETLRVLKPSGRAALLAWGSFHQPFFEATVGLVLQLIPHAKMPPEAEEMFRFATPGSLKRELAAAGFSNVHEQSLTVARRWTQKPEELWAYFQQISTLCEPLFATIPPALRPEVDARVSSALARYQDGGVLRVPTHIIVATGTKPGV